MPRSGRSPGATFALASGILLALGVIATFVFPHLRINAGGILPMLIAVSLLGGLAFTFGVELATRPLDRYRRRHQPLAGPRPGARL